jgi:serine phosphatase RsbU (regulator of sigma subunit)
MEKDPNSILGTIKQDVKQVEFKRTLKQDLHDFYRFYLSNEEREHLTRTNRIRRAFILIWWLLKSLFFKLTPVRRLLFLVGFIISCSANNLNTEPRFGVALLIFVLMLELKDKLLAIRELQTGAAVQNALKPESSPQFEGWDIWLYTRPARQVGGDLVDSIPLNPEQHVISIGDVAGKGLGAALVMAKLQATLHALAPIIDSLPLLAKQVNSIFIRNGLRNRFASLVCFSLKKNSTKISLINAGHLPPLVWRPKGLSVLPNGNPAFGLNGDSEYDLQTVELQPGQVLVAFSDGLTEARNRDGNFFGEERLYALLKDLEYRSAETIGKTIVQAVQKFVGDFSYYDDLSLVIIKKL